jgi:hypothetical protein
MIGYYTDPAVGVPDPKVAGGDPNRTTETFALDGKGRVVVVPAPEIPPPEVAGKLRSTMGGAGTGATLKRGKALPAVACYAVTIRNTGLGYIRLLRSQYANDLAYDGDIDAAKVSNKIAPSFSKRVFVTGLASELFIARDDGLAPEAFVEVTYETFIP